MQFGEDVYAFARNQGLFGGLALDGTYVMPRDDWNQVFYGQPLTAEQIVSQRAAPASARHPGAARRRWPSF